MISQKNLKKEWIFWNSYDASQLFLRKCLDQEKFVWIYIACLAGSFAASFVNLPVQVVTDVVSFEARSRKEETVGKSILPLLNKVNFTHMEIKSV